MTIEDSPRARTALNSGKTHSDRAAVDQQQQDDHDDAGDAEELAVDALERVDEGDEQAARSRAVGDQTRGLPVWAILMTAFSSSLSCGPVRSVPSARCDERHRERGRRAVRGELRSAELRRGRRPAARDLRPVGRHLALSSAVSPDWRW